MSFFPRDLAAPAVVPRSAIVWDEAACLLCGRRHWSQVLEAPDCMPGGSGCWFAVVQCQECGLCFTNPRPDVTSIGQFYPPAYRPYRVSAGRRGRRRLRWSFTWPLPGQAQRVLPWRGPGRLLDFGCGGGSFLQRMQRQGWQVTGLDSSAATVEQVRARLHMPILLGTLPHSELRPASFDVITMWQSLEHVHDPLAVLCETYRLLAPGGKLLVAVPNIDSLPFRWFGGAWIALDLPRHLTHFSAVTLQRMLARAGFQVESVRQVRHSSWMRASAARSCQHFRGPPWHRWLKIRALSRLATWYCFLTQRTDCLLVTAGRPLAS